jgi:hypothetical protein
MWDVSLLYSLMAGFEAHVVCFSAQPAIDTAKLAQAAETLDAALPQRPHEATIKFCR